MSPRGSNTINHIGTKAREAPLWWHAGVCRDHRYARTDGNYKTTILGETLAKEIHETPGKILAGDDRVPQRDPCRALGKILAEDARGATARPASAKDSTAAPIQLPARPAGQASVWWYAASTPTQLAPAWWLADLHEGSTTVPGQQPDNVALQRLVSLDARQSQARQRQLGQASLPSPIKQEGHVGSALNAFVQRCQRIDSSTVDISTSCVPLWQPLFSYKRRPEATRRRIRIFWASHTL